MIYYIANKSMGADTYMSKGKRYDDEPKLNLKKVFGTIITIAVIIMIIISINKILDKKVSEISTEKVQYFSTYLDGKWGIINSNGTTIIENTYDEMITIPNNEKPVFVCVYDVNEQTGEYKTKVINDKNENLFTQYEKVEIVENYDSKQNIWYEKDILRVLKNGKYGLINCNGEEILACEYDEITSLKSVKENFIVRKDGKVGLVNNVGQVIVPIQYAGVKVLEEGYSNEYLVVDENGNSGIISTSGTVIIEPKYQEIKYLHSTEVYTAKIENKWNLVNKTGEVINSNYDDYTYSKGDYVIVKQGEKYGIITSAGELKIEPVYEDLKYAFSVYYIAKLNGKYGVINTDNTTVIAFEYESMFYWAEKSIIIADKTAIETVLFDSNLFQKLSGIFVFEENYIKARIDGIDKYYTYNFEEKEAKDILTKNTLLVSKKDGKYGFVDKNGNVVVEHIYEEAKEQNIYGYAAVKQNGLWGVVDKTGKTVLQPQVNLDNSIYIDFIRDWHLADEGFYYTK